MNKVQLLWITIRNALLKCVVCVWWGERERERVPEPDDEEGEGRQSRERREFGGEARCGCYSSIGRRRIESFVGSRNI